MCDPWSHRSLRAGHTEPATGSPGASAQQACGAHRSHGAPSPESRGLLKRLAPDPGCKVAAPMPVLTPAPRSSSPPSLLPPLLRLPLPDGERASSCGVPPAPSTEKPYSKVVVLPPKSTEVCIQIPEISVRTDPNFLQMHDRTTPKPLEEKVPIRLTLESSVSPGHD